jgi:hypothetical protein
MQPSAAQSIVLPDYKQEVLPMTPERAEPSTVNTLPVLDIPSRASISEIVLQSASLLKKKMRILQLQIQSVVRPGAPLTPTQQIQKLKAGPGALLGETRLSAPVFHRFQMVTARQALMPGIHISKQVEPEHIDTLVGEYSHLPEAVATLHREYNSQLSTSPTALEELTHIHNYPWPDIGTELSQQDPTTVLDPADTELSNLITDYGDTNLYPVLDYDFTQVSKEEEVQIQPKVPELPRSTTLLQETLRTLVQFGSGLWKRKSTIALAGLAGLGIYATTALPQNKSQVQVFAQPIVNNIEPAAVRGSTSVPTIKLSIPKIESRQAEPILKVNIEAKQVVGNETTQWQSLPSSTTGLGFNTSGLLQLSDDLLDQASTHSAKLYFRITDNGGSQLYIPVTPDGSMSSGYSSQLGKAITAELVSKSGGVTTVYSSSKLR